MVLAALVEAARKSELFTAPRLEAHLPRFLAEHDAVLDALAGRVAAGEFDHVHFVGSSGSWTNMFSGTHLLNRPTPVTSSVLTSYELAWRDPPRLGPRALVSLASCSGATEDTLAAFRHANARGANTVAIMRRGARPGLGASRPPGAGLNGRLGGPDAAVDQGGRGQSRASRSWTPPANRAWTRSWP